MELSKMQKELILKYFGVYHKYVETSEYTEDQEHRRERQKLFNEVLSLDSIEQMTELEFGQVISSLWASQMWGNKSYLVDKLIQENGISTLKTQFKNLLWGTGNIAVRYNEFRKKVKGFGTAMLAEILAFVHPDRFGIWNDRARGALKQLDFSDKLSFINKSQLTGNEYEQFNNLLTQIVGELKKHGLVEMDFLGVNYYFFEIWAETKEVHQPPLLPPEDEKIGKSIHDDVIEQLISIGQALGFKTEREKLVAKGAKVDAIWQASIANLGVVMYVFEVQIRGSIDSLIVNLQKAQKNQSVQRLIVAATAQDIEKIRGEIADLPENFRRSVSYWDIAEIDHAASLVGELFGMINKLELVKSEFGT